jgi:hypothetical protein
MKEMAGWTGLEPATSGLTGRSSQFFTFFYPLEFPRKMAPDIVLCHAAIVADCCVRLVKIDPQG